MHSLRIAIGPFSWLLGVVVSTDPSSGGGHWKHHLFLESLLLPSWMQVLLLRRCNIERERQALLWGLDRGRVH